MKTLSFASIPESISVRQKSNPRCLRAFHGSEELKAFYIGRVRSHRIADELVKGCYWENGKGCAIGCTVHSDDHEAYERELGIPRIIARLEDGIFEGLPNREARAWPEDFLNAIPVGADLSLVWPRFAIWLLSDPDEGVIRFARLDKTRAAIQRVSDLYARLVKGEKISVKTWRTTAAAAADAAYAAYATATAAAYAADAANAAATAATANANADADAAYAAYAATYAATAAKKSVRSSQAKKLIAILKEAPIV